MTNFTEFYWFCRQLLFQFKDMAIRFFEWLTTPLQSDNWIVQGLIDGLKAILETVTGGEYPEVAPIYLFVGTGIITILVVGMIRFFRGIIY